MALTDFSFDFSAVKARIGRVFVSDDSGSTWVELGRCRDVKTMMAKVVSPKDQNGREKQLCADISADVVLTQTGADEFDNISLILHPTGNGLWVKFTEVYATTATAGAAAGVVLKNVLFTMDGELNWGGDESFLSLNITGRVAVSELAGFGTSGSVTF